MLKIINQNILESKSKYIAHQCNCTSRGSAGLAKAIFEKFPWANTYSGKRFPATIDVLGNGLDQRFVINMYAQYKPGKSSSYCEEEVYHDTKSMREFWFDGCLNRIKAIRDLESISFPEGVGCGLAGGDWNNYLQMLEDFSKTVDAEVFLCRYSTNHNNFDCCPGCDHRYCICK